MAFKIPFEMPSREYLNSQFKLTTEPDIAMSTTTESTTPFAGQEYLHSSLVSTPLNVSNRRGNQLTMVSLRFQVHQMYLQRNQFFQISADNQKRRLNVRSVSPVELAPDDVTESERLKKKRKTLLDQGDISNRELTKRLFKECLKPENKHLLKMLCKLIPKVELHFHLTGGIYPKDYLDFAYAAKLHVNLKTREFSVEPKDGSEPIFDLSYYPTPENKKKLEQLTEGMSVKYTPAVIPDNFWDSFTTSESLTTSGLMPLHKQIIRPLLEADAQNIRYIEPMSGIHTGRALPEIEEFFKDPVDREFERSSLFSVLTQVMGDRKTGWLKAEGFNGDEIADLWHFDKPYKLLLASGRIDTFVRFREIEMKLVEEEVAKRKIRCKYNLIGEVSRDTRTLGEMFTDQVCADALTTRVIRHKGTTLSGKETDPHALLHRNMHNRIIRFSGNYFNNPNRNPHAGEVVEDVNQGLVSNSELAQHVDDAITITKAKRVCHALLISPNTIALMKANGVCVDCCPKSNWLTNQIPLNKNPIHRYIASGVDVSVGSDDPAVTQFDLSSQCADLGWDLDRMQNTQRSSVVSSFLPNKDASGQEVASYIPIKDEVVKESESLVLVPEKPVQEKTLSIYDRSKLGIYTLKKEFKDVIRSTFVLPKEYAHSEKVAMEIDVERAFYEFFKIVRKEYIDGAFGDILIQQTGLTKVVPQKPVKRSTPAQLTTADFPNFA